jgi:hypothetical protein
LRAKRFRELRRIFDFFEPLAKSQGESKKRQGTTLVVPIEQQNQVGL